MLKILKSFFDFLKIENLFHIFDFGAQQWGVDFFFTFITMEWNGNITPLIIYLNLVIKTDIQPE